MTAPTRWIVLSVALTGVALTAGCAAQQRLVAADITIERDVVYATRNSQDLAADIYSPIGEGPFRGVLLVHGGSWQRGSKAQMATIGERLARRGYVAVSIDYRLAPEHRFPAQLYDCQAAVRWMRAHASRLHLDTAHVGGFGYSAGAHLVGLLATAGADDGLDEGGTESALVTRLQAAVLGAAPTDLSRFPTYSWTFERLLGASAAERPDLYARASPVTFVSPDDPPMFLYHGANDWMVAPAQSRLMLAALQRAHVPVTYLETSGGHFSTFLFDHEEVDQAIAFLDQWL